MTKNHSKRWLLGLLINTSNNSFLVLIVCHTFLEHFFVYLAFSVKSCLNWNIWCLIGQNNFFFWFQAHRDRQQKNTQIALTLFFVVFSTCYTSYCSGSTTTETEGKKREPFNNAKWRNIFVILASWNWPTQIKKAHARSNKLDSWLSLKDLHLTFIASSFWVYSAPSYCRGLSDEEAICRKSVVQFPPVAASRPHPSSNACAAQARQKYQSNQRCNTATRPQLQTASENCCCKASGPESTLLNKGRKKNQRISICSDCNPVHAADWHCGSGPGGSGIWGHQPE